MANLYKNLNAIQINVKDAVIKHASGNTIRLDNVSDVSHNLEVVQYGQCVQDGTPTPAAPIPVTGKAAGVNVRGKNFLETRADTFTTNGVTFSRCSNGGYHLSGLCNSTINIRVSELFTLSPGTYYTDTVLWLADTVSVVATLNTPFTISAATTVRGIFRIVEGTSYESDYYPCVSVGSTSTPYEPYKATITQAVTDSNGDPVTLYGIPVASGGNVTIGGQQYVADTLDGTTVTRRINVKIFTGTEGVTSYFTLALEHADVKFLCTHSQYEENKMRWANSSYILFDQTYFNVATPQELKEFLTTQYAANTPVTVYYAKSTPTTEQVTISPATVVANSPTTTLISEAYSEVFSNVIANHTHDKKADLDSPEFTGTPTAPTPTVNDNSTKIATTEFVSKHSAYSMISYATSLTDTAGRWTVTIPGITELFDGLSIKIKLSTSYNSSYNTLDVNGFGPKLVWYRYNSRLTSHFSINTEIELVYRTTAGSYDTYTDGWIIQSAYYSDSDTRSANIYFRPYAGKTIYSYKLCGLDANGKLQPLTLENGTGTTKTVNTEPLDFSKGIFLYNTTTTSSINTSIVGQILYNQTYLTVPHYTTNETLPAYQYIYLKGSINSNGLFVLDNSTYTSWVVKLPYNSIPNLSDYFANDGSVYVFLGATYSSANYLQLFDTHPMYVFDGNHLVEYVRTHIHGENVTELTVSGKNITVNKGDGTTSVITTQDTVTTVSTSGSGNAITDISASNGALTATKGSTFLTAHPTISKTTDSTSVASPSHGATFTAVDNITRDTNGHVTKINTKTITLPADNNTYLSAKSDDGYKIAVGVTNGTTLIYDEIEDRKITAVDTVTTSTADIANNDTIKVALKKLQNRIDNTEAVATGAMTFKGTTAVAITATAVIGDTYKATASFTIAAANSSTNAAIVVNIGDAIVAVASAPKWTVIPSGDDALNVATDSSLGGIKIGYTGSGKNYPVELDSNNKAFVNVPWTDTNTTYTLSSITGTLAIAKGGTGATTAAAALTNLGITATAAELNILDGVTATTTELNYIDGVTSNIQTQLNGKAPTNHTHTSSITVTLLASGWDSNGHQTVAVSGLGATQNAITSLATGITTAQYEAASGASLSAYAQAAGSITFAVNGDVPTIDIPISVIILG